MQRWGRAIPAAPVFVGGMVAARHDPEIKAFRDRLVQAGKPKLVALVATARKLLTILNAIIATNSHGANKPLDPKDSRSPQPSPRKREREPRRRAELRAQCTYFLKNPSVLSQARSAASLL